MENKFKGPMGEENYTECLYAFYGDTLLEAERRQKTAAHSNRVGLMALSIVLLSATICLLTISDGCGNSATAQSNSTFGTLTASVVNTSSLTYDHATNGILSQTQNFFTSNAGDGQAFRFQWGGIKPSDGAILSAGINDSEGNYQELGQISTASHNLGGFCCELPPVGQGELRLFDRVGSFGFLDLGFYAFGASLQTPNLFETYTRGFSIRDYDATQMPILFVRDQSDRFDIRLFQRGDYAFVQDTGPAQTVVIMNYLGMLDPTGTLWYIFPSSNGQLLLSRTHP